MADTTDNDLRNQIERLADELRAEAEMADAQYEHLTEVHGGYGAKKERAFLLTSKSVLVGTEQRLRDLIAPTPAPETAQEAPR